MRIGVAGEFLGHGFLALEGKKDWINWISQMINVNESTATSLLTLVGVSDVLVALIVLVRPVSFVLLWATFWGFWTALVRPIMGIGWWDFIERFANWAAPLALYYLRRVSKGG